MNWIYLFKFWKKKIRKNTRIWELFFFFKNFKFTYLWKNKDNTYTKPRKEGGISGKWEQNTFIWFIFHISQPFNVLRERSCE